MKTIFTTAILLLWLLKPATAQLQANMYWNPVTVNGHPIDYGAFSIHTQGVMALVQGDLRSPRHKKVPFRVSIRRDGKIVRQWPAGNAANHYALQLNTLMPFVRFGDELVVEPVGAGSNSRWDKQIIRVAIMNWINWFKGDGC